MATIESTTTVVLTLDEDEGMLVLTAIEEYVKDHPSSVARELVAIRDQLGATFNPLEYQ